MAKKIKRGQNSETVTPQKVRSPYISRKHIADFFGLNEKSLLFAVAETPDDECGVFISPVIAILGTEEYVSLADGVIEETARARGQKQDLYPAIVSYDGEQKEFVFKSSVGSRVRISMSSLSENFGKSVVQH